jgi:two-component system nitrate/nitrite response regulator NarL
MRILIADDNELVRRGVIDILRLKTSWEICGEAADGIETLRKARELLPDIILLDISMPGLNGLETARLLQREVPGARILVMSQHDPIRLAPSAADAGACGCLDKSRLATDLLPAVERAANS